MAEETGSGDSPPAPVETVEAETVEPEETGGTGGTLPAPVAAQAVALAASFEPVPVRPRADGWTPAKQRAFIEALADTNCAAAAAARVGMSAESAHRLRRRPGAEGFSAAWDAALLLTIRHCAVSKAVETALNGTIVRRYYHGQVIAEERVYSEKLLLWLLEKGEKLLARGEAIAADWDASMGQLEAGLLGHGCRVWKDRVGAWRTNFPPPPDYSYGEEGTPGTRDYVRYLSDEEEAALERRAPQQSDDAARARDAFFGFTPRGKARRGRSRRRP